MPYFRSRNLCCNRIFRVPRVPIVENKGFLGTGTACGCLFGAPAGRFFYAVTVGVEFLGSE